ncbi:Pr6Pr family membrane protein [Streptococcus sp. DD12]|uniref:Pr6Pr family membrane protein n=1 Tax=Streptococcus sp. DD12 TaxID=1777880 RepID=UPI0007992D83|nr:Pr6Pr family membrane protein [Streptococcus sp. DD12]KXT76187.1 hypothetical protein STRDD12_00683 [Streptococcus sp. DD12]
MTPRSYYRIFLTLIASCGLYLQISQSGPGMLLYYTVFSNLLVWCFLIYLIWRDLKKRSDNRLLLRQKGLVTLAIGITFVVYHFLLSPYVKPADFWTLRNLSVHYLVPIGFILDTLILDRTKSYRFYDPFVWTLVPLAYFAFALFNGLVLKWPVPGTKASPFPYWFIDLNHTAPQKVLSFVLIIFFGYLFSGYLLLFIKIFFGKKR